MQNKSRREYLRILATADLFHYVPKDYQDKHGSRAYFPTEDIHGGSLCIVVRTAGERLPRRAQFVAVRTSLPELEAVWPGSRYTLHVNPGTPAFMRLTASALDRRRWRKTAAEATASLPTDSRPTRLLTKYTGPRTGPLAHALACGAHLSVANGVLWNEIGDVYDSYGNEVKTLREWWGTTTAHEWQEQMDALLSGTNSPPEPQFVLDVRQQLALETEGRVDTELWRRTCTAVLANLEAPAEVERTVQELIGRVLRYEARFRADGLLPPDGFVRSAVGYDYGRAVGFARWGLSARLCPFSAAEEAVLRAGELCREAYRSWEDFSAGYALGRVLRFDTEEFGQWYTKVLDPHLILTKDEESPWRTIPWNSTSTV
ncbi:hypothetical protein CTZ27_07815 [Streptomyces griseocarneus]|nr:hypothetical protein CTZ27_07815 [Streptomyces griseocarneus]